MNVQDSLQVAELLWPKFTVVDGGFYLEGEWSAAQINIADFRNLTEAEVFVNHVNILDRFDHEAALSHEPWWDRKHPDFQTACHLGRTAAHAWARKLLTDFPEHDFAVYFNSEYNPILRFHSIREGEPLWMDADRVRADLDEGNALIVDTRSLRRRIDASA